MSKTRMGKRVASLLLSLVMMLSLLPTTVYATDDTGATNGAIQQTEPVANTENTGEPESTGEGKDGSANVTEGETGNGSETSGTNVAQVGDTQYETLEAAIDAATAGQTVTLLANVNENVEIAKEKNLTLDLNGFTLNGGTGTAVAALTNYGTITIKDSSTAKTGTIKRDDMGTVGETSYYVILNQGTMTIESGTVSNNSGYEKANSTGSMVGSSLICNGDCNGGSTLTINGGTFTQYNFIAIKNGALGVLNVTGGMITSNHSAIQNWFEANITGGEIKGQLWTDAYTAGVSDGKTKIGGNATFTGEIVMDIYGNSVAPKLEITSGKLDVTNWKITDAAAAVGAKPAVSGGTFTAEVPAEYLADGFEIKQNSDGSYGVEKSASYVAKIGEKGYDTLEEAINATVTGDTVTLLADVDLGSSSVSFYNKKDTSVCDLTFDLNGHTITSAIGDNGTVLAAREGLVIKNGAIVNTSESTNKKTSAICVTSKGTTTIENVTVTSKVSGVYICQLTSTGAEVVNVESGTFISGEYGVYIANPKGSTTKSPVETLNINGGTINGTHTGVYAKGAESGSRNAVVNVNITAGTVSSVGVYGAKEEQPVNLTVSGGTISDKLHIDNLGGKALVTGGAVKGAVTNSGTLTISGGTFNGDLTNKTNGSITITGGTFAIKPDTTYLAEGYTITENADGTYGIKKTTYVAEVNGTQYISLQAAIDAAGRKTTVKLLADTRENVTISTPYLTLDLNGFTLNGSTGERKPALTVTARVTVKDSSENQTGTIMREDTAENSGVSSHYVIDVQGDGWLTFESGNVKNNSGIVGVTGASLVRVGDDSVAKYPGLNIKGGTFTQDNFIVIKVDRGDLFLNGGTLNSAHSYAIEDWHRATIKGGTVNGTVAAWTYSGGLNSDLTISGGTINGDVTSVNYGNAEDRTATVTITGGIVNGQLDTRSYDPATNELTSINDAAKATIEVTSGTFNSDPTKYVVESSTVTKNSEGKYGVEKAYLATVGETSYYTMEEAFKAQTASGEPIVMLRDYTTGGTFNSGSINRTVDLDGHTWTYTGTDTNDAAFEINYSDVTLTVKNGTVVSNSMVGLIPSAMGGTITYDNSGLVFEDVTMTANGHSGIETNGNNTNDTVTLKNSTLNVPNGFGIYFPSSGTLTIDNSQITAKTMGVQVCSGSLNINAGSGITVTGDEVPKTENDGAIQDGAAISIVNRTGYKGLGDVTVTGGTFTAKAGNDAIKAYDWANNTATDFTANDKVFVSGGTFSSIPDNMTELCAKDYIPELTPSGAYEVRKADYVAAISDKQYTSLANAIAAAKDGDTVKLLDDVVLDKTLIIKDKTITLDLNGKTISNSVDIWNENTYAWSLISVRDKGNLTIDDTTGGGTLKAKENDCFALDVYAYDTKNVENTKLTINAGNYVGNISAVYAFTGKATINGGHFSIQQKESGSDPYRLTLNCYDSSYTAGRAHITVTGGTFVGFDPANNKAEGEGTSFVPDGYVPKANGDGSYTVVKGTYVAEYNDTKYTSLQEAIDAASKQNYGQTEVKLLCNLTITETIVFAKQYSVGSVLLNLGGYTLTGEGCRALQINKGNLYLENGTVTSIGDNIVNSSSVIRIGSNEAEYSGISPMLYMRNGAKVLAPKTYGVTLFGSATVKEKLTVAGNASIVATGPSPAISGNGDKAYHVDGKGTEITITGNAVVSAENNYAIYHPDNGTLKIQDSATVSGKGGIQMCSGTLTISGSPKIEALGKADHETGAAGPIYDIAAISVVNRSYPGGAPVVTIKGTPTVTANEGEVIHAYTWSSNTESVWAEAGKNINVSGGTYSKTFNEAYLAADCTLVDGENGTYTVEQKPVAEYNGTQYTSLPQAILDANNSEAGGTVKLLDNVTLTRDLGIGGSAPVTLDLDKKTLTLNGAQIYTQGSATVTINNGTIKRTDEPTSGSPNDFAIQVMSGSSLTLGATSADTVTIESTYGVYNAGGTLTVSHATITTDGWSIAVNDSASKTGVVTIGEGAVITSRTGNCISTMVNSKPNVTITGGQLTSNGTAWDAGVIYWASEGTLTITGGTFTASSDEGSTAAAVHQKNGTVKISGTTAKLLGNNALVVQAGDGSTGTMVTELSGGTYSTKPDDSWVVDGYRAIGNTDGSFTVKEANIAIQVTSRIKDDGVTTVSTTTGGGMYCEGEKVTVTTSNVIGFEFLGWYKMDSYNGAALFTGLSYTFTASEECTLVALYKPAENATLTVKVTASAFTITGSKWVQNNGGMYKLPVGSSVTVTYTDDTYAFLYWVNGSDKIVSTNSKYTFTLGSNTELRACTSPKNTGNDNAMVVFKTAYDQVLTAQRYDVAEEIVFPMGPSKTGYKFIGWNMTQAEIRAAMVKNDYIVVTPKYETLGTKYTVTVRYAGIDKAEDKHTINVGDSTLLTAAERVGEKTFSYWMIDDQIVSYLTTLTVFESKDVTVTAVYGVEANAKAKIRISDVSATQDGLYYLVTFTQAFALPEDATLVLTGFIRADDEESAANMNINRYSKIYKSSLTTNDGTYYQTIASKNADKTYYMMAFVQYKDAKGDLQTVYSECVQASYASLKGGN